MMPGTDSLCARTNRLKLYRARLFTGDRSDGLGRLGRGAARGRGRPRRVVAGHRDLRAGRARFLGFRGFGVRDAVGGRSEKPHRDLPRAYSGAWLLIFVAYLSFGVGGAFLIDRATLAQSPAPHLDLAVAVYGPGARIWFSILAVLASASLFNTVLAAVPRMILGMANNGQVFPVFKYVHPRFQTPIVAILFVAALPLVGLLWSQGDAASILPFIVASSITWLLAYIVAQVSVLVLRYRHPEWAPAVPGSAVSRLCRSPPSRGWPMSA